MQLDEAQAIIDGLDHITVSFGGRNLNTYNPNDPAFRARVLFDLERFRLLISELQPLAPDGRLLEVGAPPFILTSMLARCGYAVTANGMPVVEWPTIGTLSISSHSVGVPDATLPIKMFDAEDTFPFDDKSFDIVVAGEIFEHLYKQPWMLLSEAWRCLVPGGIIVLTTPNGQSFEALYRWIKRAHTGHGFNPNAPSIRHAREYNTKELAGVLRSQGFDPIAVRSFNEFHVERHNGVLAPVKQWIYRTLKEMGAATTGPLRDRGNALLAIATRSPREPSTPPETFLYGAEKEGRTGFNF